MSQQNFSPLPAACLINEEGLQPSVECLKQLCKYLTKTFDNEHKLLLFSHANPLLFICQTAFQTSPGPKRPFNANCKIITCTFPIFVVSLAIYCQTSISIEGNELHSCQALMHRLFVHRFFLNIYEHSGN